jgi:copper chaperone NosL
MILQPRWWGFKKSKLALATIVILTIQSCSAGPQPIRYGSDACDFCKMTIMEKKFANEWVTAKGKVYRFDDIHCLISFRKTDKSEGTTYINDFAGKKELNKASDLFYVRSEELKTPMNGKVTAFIDKTVAEEFAKKNNGENLSWNEVESGF